jgi:hypothetical protein
MVMALEIECRILFALPPGYKNGSLSKISTTANDPVFLRIKLMTQKIGLTQWHIRYWIAI